MPKLTRNQWLIVAANFAIYSLLGWKFAVAVTIGIFFHELGHLIASERLGMKTSGMWLIPFLGGAAVNNNQYKTMYGRANVALAGPIIGSIPAVVFIALYWATGIHWLASAAFWILAINVVNLPPLFPILDGAKIIDSITYSIDRKFGLYVSCAFTCIGYLALVGIGMPIFGMFILLVSFSVLMSEWENQRNESHGLYERCTKGYLNKPYPMSKIQISNILGIWTASILTMITMCLYVHHIGLDSIGLLLK